MDARLSDALTPEECFDCTYWKHWLQDAPLALDLPTDYPRSSARPIALRKHSFIVSQSLSAALKTFSQQEEVSVFMTLFVVLQVFLYRYTGQDDLLVGVPGMQRTFEGYAFANVLMLRTQLVDNPVFRALLARVREVVLEAYRHQDVPFAYVMQALKQERDAGSYPVCQVMFALKEASQETTQEVLREFPMNLPTMEIETGDEMMKRDLTVVVQDTEETLTGYFEYNATLFKEATIVRMIHHWQRLLEGILANPDQHIADLPLLTDAEWEQQAVAWNATHVDYPRDRCLHELFEAQVERTPDAVALVFEQQRLTYRELNKRANQIAHYLQDVGVEPETLVALLIERSIDFVASMLAIFKAGSAFLPMDPQHPARRHYQVLKQSRCRFVLTTDRYTSTLTEAVENSDISPRPQVLYVEKLFTTKEAEENLPLRSTPENLAYVMYTSGSTGEPKGVMVEQVGMVNHIFAKIADLSIGMEDSVAQNGPPCFDIVVWQCLAALLVGGSVHIFSDEVALDPVQLLEHIEQQKITILQAVPSILRAVVQQAEKPGKARPHLASLRWVVPTGDALPTELCRRWLQLYPSIPLLNTYGSTECSDDQCHYAIYQPPPLDYPLAIMPIGRPIQNMCAYVLDQQLMLVPVGVVGDLYIGGIGVGRGYLYDAVKTDEVFIPDLFSQEPGRRLYKTRDRVRYLADGSIEFLGRSDNLVKIQGVRIEPGEIEAVLEQHPVIKEAVVVSREATGGTKFLVAYVVPKQHQGATSEEVRAWLRKKLPEYMIPSAFVVLSALPLNSNGKVDRRALPAPERLKHEMKETFVAPMMPMQEQLKQIWEELLEVRPVGIKDNFFELGGHSLLAVRLVARIEQVWGKKISSETLLAGATIEQLADAILQAQSTVPDTTSKTAPESIETSASKQPFLLSKRLTSSVRSALSTFTRRHQE